MDWIVKLIAGNRVSVTALDIEILSVRPNQVQQAMRSGGTAQFIASRFTLPPRNTMVRLNTVPPLLHTQWIPGDGNCMFSAFANAIGTPGISHKTVRRAAIGWARQNKDFVEAFLTEEQGGIFQYLRSMAEQGTWGDHIMLRVLCSAYDVKVVVIKRMEDGRLEWNYVGEREEGDRYMPLWLAGEHYENMVTVAEMYGFDG